MSARVPRRAPARRRAVASFRPDAADYATVGLLAARIGAIVAAAMVPVAVLATLWSEPDAASALVIGACLGLLLWLAAERYLSAAPREARWQLGLVGCGLGWLLAALLGGVPLYLSGHFGSFLDAWFEAMSGLTTTGLSLVHDLDHLPDAFNLWRHVLQLLGGLGVVVLLLSLFAAGGGAVGMYAGEARQDQLLPHVLRSSRFVARAAAVYGAIAIVALAVALLVAGVPPARVGFHALTLLLAAVATGGFAAGSASVQAYHSGAVEAVVAVVLVVGAVSFAVHQRVWQGDARELVRNLETRVLAVTVLATFAIAAAGLVVDGAPQTVATLWRHTGFQVLSAHTGSGLTTVPAGFLASGWGVLAPGALVLAMSIGGMSGSTAGGIKAIRVAIAAKVLRLAARRAALPPDAVDVISYHHVQDRRLTPRVAGAAVTLLLLYLVLAFAGTVAGLFYGYPLEAALFEATSATANGGLTAGITDPAMPTGLKVVYLLQMWIGRLELVGGLAVIGFGWAALRSRR